VQALIRERTGAVCDIQIIRTKGDRIDDVAFEQIEGKGFFTKEIEDALLSGRIDIAVHSLKDLPTESPAGLAVAAIPQRAAPNDVLLVRPEFHDPECPPLQLRAGARVGTSSVRRRAQLATLQPSVTAEPLRGNVPTRIRRLLEGQCDAIVLAAAGIDRLQIHTPDLVRVTLPIETFVPAPGQGALAIQIRSDDPERRELVATLHDPDTAEAVNAERSLLSRFGGGCSLPLGASVRREGSSLSMSAFWKADNSPAVRVTRRGTSISTLRDIVYRALCGDATPLGGQRVIVTRSSLESDPLVGGLRDLGAEVVSFPVICIAATPVGEADTGVREALDSYDWVLFASANAVEHFWGRLGTWGMDFPAKARIGAVGPGTARALLERGRTADYVPEDHISDALLEGILSRCKAGSRILIPCARHGRDVLDKGLVAAGHQVSRYHVYETRATDPGLLDRQSLDGAHYVLFASPSAVRYFLDAAPLPKEARVVSIGPVTSAAARELGLRVHAEATPHTVEGMIECLLND